MKILALMNLDIFRLTFGWSLESLGHEVYYLDDLTEENLKMAVETFQPHMMFDMGWDVWHCNYVDGDLLATRREIKDRYNLFHVYFAEEDQLHHDLWSRKYCELMRPDFVLTRGKTCVSFYESMGIPAAYFDVGCNPEFHRPVPASFTFACDVSVLVNAQFTWDIYRRTSIEHLIVPLFDQPYDTRIWGREWEQVEQYYGVSPRYGMLKGLLPYHFTPTVYNSSKINISVQSMVDQVSNRTYDILSSGGFLLTSDTPAVRENMTPGIHCEVSSSKEETLEKIDFYLRHDEARKRIAHNGMQHARENLSYQITLPAVWPQVAATFTNWQQKGVGV